MKRVLFSISLILLLSTVLWAQPQGSVAGAVLFPDGVPVPGADIRMDGVGGRHHPHFFGRTNAEGLFGFPHVPVGSYNIMASFHMRGFARALIEVVEGQTTNVTLTLQPRDTTRRDSLTVVDLQGVAIVTYRDSTQRFARYFLDVDGDGEADYRLCFGPPWYDPGSGAARPQNGDEITIRGGLFSYVDPPLVVVYEINGLFWRTPGRGHGGHGGGDHWRRGCDPDSVTLVEFEGIAIVHPCRGHHGEQVCYEANVDENPHPDYILDFGRPDYDPGNGAQRPGPGDSITIVGGQIYCRDEMIPIVIVYEINGMFWREPGDTLGMGPMVETAVDDPILIGEPSSYVVARNYPNPFNPSTTIEYSIPEAGNVRLTVFDITGRAVAELVNGYQQAGSYVKAWNAAEQPSGIYFYRVEVGALKYTGRMVLMK